MPVGSARTFNKMKRGAIASLFFWAKRIKEKKRENLPTAGRGVKREGLPTAGGGRNTKGTKVNEGNGGAFVNFVLLCLLRVPSHTGMDKGMYPIRESARGENCA